MILYSGKKRNFKEYMNTTRMMLADEKIMKTARELKSQRPQHKGYWQSGYRDMLFVILNEKGYIY